MIQSLSRRSLLAALLLQPDNEVSFSDYTNDFQVDAQRREPRVKCYDLRRLESSMTPVNEFFAFHQGRTMRVDAGLWRLRLSGAVQRAAEWTLDELRMRRDVVTVSSAIECSGNSGNSVLMNGLVSSAVWTGVPLAALLMEAGLKREAREVVLLGVDTNTERKWSAAGQEFTVPHGRSLQVQDALEAGGILAFGMNGVPLPAEQGFPLRLVLPGWYGMAQIKWLTRIEVIDRRYEGQHMSRNYHSLHRLEDGLLLDTSITRNRLKSVVAAIRRLGNGIEVVGAAWGGASPVRAVEVRIGKGPWVETALGPAAGSGWRLWSLNLPRLAAGAHEAVSRAISEAGEVQPTREEWRLRFASNREDHSQWVRRFAYRP